MKRWRHLLLLGAGIALVGCRSSGRTDLLEAELRSRDAEVREIRAELERTLAENHHLQRELRHLHQAGHALPTGARTSLGVQTVALGRQTSGVDEDRVPGDEAIQVVIEPRDGDGHTIKAAGRAVVSVLEISTEGLKRPLATWQVSEDEIRRSWRSGLLSTGYYLTFPWKIWPSNQKVRIVVQFIGSDERLFEAEKDVTIRLTPLAYRPQVLPTVEPPLVPGCKVPSFLLPKADPPQQPAVPAPPSEDLPQPRKVEPPPPTEGPRLSRQDKPPAVQLLKPVTR
jgi:hypothetical protein